MSRRTIQLEDRTIIFSPDDPVALANRFQALLKLRITDELTGLAPESTIYLRVEERGYITRVAADGLAGLIGIPLRVIPHLDAKNYSVNLTVTANGYVTRELHEDIPQDLTFPGHFVPRQINLALHREPVSIFGRTIRRLDNVPLAGAEVTLTGIWRLPADVTVVAADPPNIVSLQPSLYLDRQATTQVLEPRDLPIGVGTAKTLTKDVAPGSDAIELSDVVGIANGDILQIDVDQPDLAEFVEIQFVPTTSPADQETLITLNQALINPHRRDAVIKKTSPQPAGPSRPFTLDATAGDTCVFVDNLTGLSSGHTVQISGPPNKDEYHQLMIFSATSDSDGYYRLPPLSRVAQIEVHAEKIVGAQTFEATTVFSPDYSLRENHLDLALTV